MFDLINGLPVHPLVVHGVVVLLPLAVLGTLLIALRPAWRERYLVLVFAAAAVGTVLIPVATSSGEALEKRVGIPGDHAALGDQLLWFTLPLVLVLAAMVLLQWRARRANTTGSGATGSAGGASSAGASTLTRVLPVVAVLAALLCTVQVVRVGDSGARAAWSDQVSGSSAASDGGR